MARRSRRVRNLLVKVSLTGGATAAGRSAHVVHQLRGYRSWRNSSRLAAASRDRRHPAPATSHAASTESLAWSSCRSDVKPRHLSQLFNIKSFHLPSRKIAPGLVLVLCRAGHRGYSRHAVRRGPPRARTCEDITLFPASFHVKYPFSAKVHRNRGRCRRPTVPSANRAPAGSCRGSHTGRHAPGRPERVFPASWRSPPAPPGVSVPAAPRLHQCARRTHDNPRDGSSGVDRQA